MLPATCRLDTSCWTTGRRRRWRRLSTKTTAFPQSDPNRSMISLQLVSVQTRLGMAAMWKFMQNQPFTDILFTNWPNRLKKSSQCIFNLTAIVTAARKWESRADTCKYYVSTALLQPDGSLCTKWWNRIPRHSMQDCVQEHIESLVIILVSRVCNVMLHAMCVPIYPYYCTSKSCDDVVPKPYGKGWKTKRKYSFIYSCNIVTCHERNQVS